MSEHHQEEEPVVVTDPGIEDEEPVQDIEQEEIDRQLSAVIEGLLFLTGDEGLNTEMVAEVLEISPEKAENLLEGLQIAYLQENRGMEIARYGKTYRFLSKAFVHPYAKKLFQLGRTGTLSPAALETLARSSSRCKETPENKENIFMF